MKTDRIDEMLSLTCRLCLWLDDELEPTNRQTLLEDLQQLAEFASAVQNLAREWMTNHPASQQQ